MGRELGQINLFRTDRRGLLILFRVCQNHTNRGIWRSDCRLPGVDCVYIVFYPLSCLVLFYVNFLFFRLTENFRQVGLKMASLSDNRLTNRRLS